METRPASYHRTSPKRQPTLTQAQFTFNKIQRFTEVISKRSGFQASNSLDCMSTKRELKLYEIDFDYGKLQAIKDIPIEPPARANTPVKMSRKTCQETSQKQDRYDSSRITTKTKQTAKSKYSSKQNNTETSKKGNRPLPISAKYLKLDRSINPNEPKHNETRLVTMFVAGKIKTKLIVYPDTSQYLRLCGIKGDC